MGPVAGAGAGSALGAVISGLLGVLGRLVLPAGEWGRGLDMGTYTLMGLGTGAALGVIIGGGLGARTAAGVPGAGHDRALATSRECSAKPGAEQSAESQWENEASS